ncbi:hypothetical protein ABTJ52_22015, partial [Acinetobacter baumannii]
PKKLNVRSVAIRSGFGRGIWLWIFAHSRRNSKKFLVSARCLSPLRQGRTKSENPYKRMYCLYPTALDSPFFYAGRRMLRRKIE